jgi:hypothetical protein
MPQEGAIPPSNSEMASSPPAEAPIPTTVNDRVDSSSAVAPVVTAAPVTKCGRLSFAGSGRATWSEKRSWPFKRNYLTGEEADPAIHIEREPRAKQRQA